ncbi:MAG: T9SS type A sorting domain-containing protein [Bacteroidota bacterium]|nr:T9SS type A sorting domain-containing protein [Bacteroidota bacterium]
MVPFKRQNTISSLVPVHSLRVILPNCKKKKWLLVNIFIILNLLPGPGIAQNISTLAGTGTAGYNGDGIPATSAQLNGPQGIALDASKNIYIADLVNSRVRKVDNVTGMISTIAGTGTPGYNGDGIAATAAQISFPSALAFDGNGDLYFTDRGNHRIRKINMSTGMISTIAGTGTPGYNGDGIAATAAQLNAPNEVAFDTAGNLFIADWQNHRVRRVDKVTGMISTIAGTGTAGYNGDGIPATSAQIDGPCGIIFDKAGNIYFAEYSGHRVRKISGGTGLISTIAGTATAGYNGDGILATTAQLSGCAYIKFDDAENMYIGDAFNARVRRITASTGIISTVAGTGTAGYNGDGIPATTAQLNLPFYIYFDRPQCYMYIGDYQNNRVRAIAGGFIGCVPLPLELLYFTGTDKGSFNLLQWQAAGKINDAAFRIERSNDPRSFETIGIVNGRGNSTSSYSYSFLDQYPLAGINYYRLRQTQNDGQFIYSSVITVTKRQTGNNLFITMYPNPGDGRVTISSSAMMEELKISNLAGQIIYRMIPRARNTSLQLQQPGIYFIQITAAYQTITKKLIVSR